MAEDSGVRSRIKFFGEHNKMTYELNCDKIILSVWKGGIHYHAAE